MDFILNYDFFNANAWFTKGYALKQMKNLEDSKICYELAVEIAPNLYKLGIIPGTIEGFDYS